MTQTAVPGGEEITGGRTVVVGVKLDAQSRELLTWALVKVAHAGDRVIAVHVLDNNEIVDSDGKSPLLSLVKAFDSIIAVYEGFCNLKQVDLKLKICRGVSVRKTLVGEAKTYSATAVIVGTSQAHHRTIRSNASSVAKYCAKKLPKGSCSVLAVNNGKIAYHRGASSISRDNPKEIEHHHHRNRLLSALQRSWSKNVKAVGNGTQMLAWDETACNEKSDSFRPLQRSCSICSHGSPKLDSLCGKNSTIEPSDSNGDGGNNDSGDRSMAIVPFHNHEPSISLLLNQVVTTEQKPGWPLLRLPNGNSSYKSNFRKISVVQWAMQLPNRYRVPVEHSISSDLDGQKRIEVSGGESLAIVPIGTDNASSLPSPDHIARTLPKELQRFHDKYSATFRLFKFDELALATSNFQPGNIIGKGGSSHVYRGSLPGGKEIAVKILKPSEDSLKEFILEIEIITTLHHKNIMSLLGFCFEDDNLLLVYDFIPRGSLEDNLHGVKREQTSFGWRQRFKVAIGVAEALDYLHSREEDQSVIHRDVKSSNILLLDDFEPQLSDFGLARWASSASAHITCADVAGTFGYLAPEYFMYGKVNEKIDVYAFGVVLLELLSGRKPISSALPKGQESLVMWAKPILNSDKFFKLIDPNLGSEYDEEQVERMVLSASLCIRQSSRARPRMNLVLKLLRGEVEVIKWARLQVNSPEGIEGLLLQEDEMCSSQSNLQSHLNVALLGIDEDSSSVSSVEQSVSLEGYLRGRWSRSSSLD